MPYPSESHKEILARMDRDHARFIKRNRRERWSFFAFMIAATVYISIVPFIRSLDLIMLLLVILLLFYVQFVVIMELD